MSNTSVKQAERKVAKLSSKRVVLLSELRKAQNQLNRARRIKIAHGCRIGALRDFIANSNGTFTTRDAAKVVYPEVQNTTERETRLVSVMLLPMVKQGIVHRTQRNAADANNSGQLLYSKAN